MPAGRRAPRGRRGPRAQVTSAECEEGQTSFDDLELLADHTARVTATAEIQTEIMAEVAASRGSELVVGDPVVKAGVGGEFL